MEAKVIPSAVYYASIGLLVCIYISAVPACIELCKFAKTMHFHLADDFFQTRRPSLHILYIAAFLVVLYILNPLSLYLHNIYGLQSTVPLLLNDASDMLIVFTLFPRACILFYDHLFVHHLRNWTWRREINPQDAGCIVRHRRHLRHSVALVYSIYISLISPVVIALHGCPYFGIYPAYCHRILSCFLMVLTAVTLYLVCNISVVCDEYYVRAELLDSLKSTGIAYILAHFLFDIVLFSHTEWALFWEICMLTVAGFGVLYYATYWTRRKYEFHHRYIVKRSRFSFHCSIPRYVQIQDIMRHKEGIDAFCHHLTTEFGLESILFLIETVQFKAVLRQNGHDWLTDNVPELCDSHKRVKDHIFSAAYILNIHWLPIDPRMFSMNAYQLALHLYDKYVDESADLCVNLSASNRRNIYLCFQALAQQNTLQAINLENHEILQELYAIFDDAFREIWMLIKTDSFIRFRMTDEFRRLMFLLFPQEAKAAQNKEIEIVDAEIAMHTGKHTKITGHVQPETPREGKMDSSAMAEAKSTTQSAESPWPETVASSSRTSGEKLDVSRLRTSSNLLMVAHDTSSNLTVTMSNTPSMETEMELIEVVVSGSMDTKY